MPAVHCFTEGDEQDNAKRLCVQSLTCFALFWLARRRVVGDQKHVLELPVWNAEKHRNSPGYPADFNNRHEDC